VAPVLVFDGVVAGEVVDGAEAGALDGEVDGTVDGLLSVDELYLLGLCHTTSATIMKTSSATAARIISARLCLKSAHTSFQSPGTDHRLGGPLFSPLRDPAPRALRLSRLSKTKASARYRASPEPAPG